MIRHQAPISGVAAFADRLVATAGYDNQVILWDAGTGTALARGCHDHLANQCEFSADGQWLLSSSSDYSARLWSVPDMRLWAVLAGHEDDVEGIAFHPSEALIATASRDRTIMIFDHDGRPRQRLTGHGSDVLSVAWLDGGAQLVSSSDDGTIRRWDARSGRMTAAIDFAGVETDTIAIADDGTIFAGNDLGEIVIVRGEARETVHAHDAGIKKIVFDRRAGRLVSLSYDRHVRFWRYAGGGLSAIRSEKLPAAIWPRACAFVGDAQVAFATFGSTFATFDLDRAAWDLDRVAPTGGVNAACLDGDRFYTIGDAGIVRSDGAEIASVGSLCNFIIGFGGQLLCGGQLGQVIDARTGRICHQHRSPLNCAIRVKDAGAPALLVGSYTGEALLFHLRADRAAFVREIRLHDNAIKGLAANAQHLFSVCASGAAAIHRIGDWTAVMEDLAAHGKIANGCAALPDGRFASVSRDMALRLWRAGTAELHETPHLNSIKCCAASADGQWIATGDYAGRIGLFDVAARCYAAFSRYSASGISSLLALPQGGFAATCYDGNLYEAGVSEARARRAA